MKYVEYLKNTTDCILCNYPKELQVYTGKLHSIILARAPYAKDHLMIIPHRHIHNFHDLTRDEYDELGELTEKANLMIYHMGYESLSLFVRDGIIGDKSGKSISHFHYHILPDVDVRGVVLENDKRHFMDDDEFQSETTKMKIVWDELYK